VTPAQHKLVAAAYFHQLLTCDQAERDAAPCAEPAPSHIGLMRNGIPVFLMSLEERDGVIYQPFGTHGWDAQGRPLFRPYAIDETQHDLIATLDLTATLKRLTELEAETLAEVLE
jgi:hypothetical protein